MPGSLHRFAFGLGRVDVPVGDAVAELLHDVQAFQETLLVEGPVELLPQFRLLEYVPVLAESDPPVLVENVLRAGGEILTVVAVEGAAEPALDLFQEGERLDTELELVGDVGGGEYAGDDVFGVDDDEEAVLL